MGSSKHIRTPPRGADTCFGTLVIALPVPFTGGELRLAHGTKDTTVNWSKALQPVRYWAPEAEKAAHVPTNAGLQWTAFFGDVEHEVSMGQLWGWGFRGRVRVYLLALGPVGVLGGGGRVYDLALGLGAVVFRVQFVLTAVKFTLGMK